MKNLNLSVFVVAITLTACGQHDVAPSSAVMEMAAKYCAKDFKPYDSLSDACTAEIGKGKRGAACATFAQLDEYLGKLHVASNFKECSGPEFRFGPNAKKN